MNNRKIEYDIAKGIGMLAIIIGHIISTGKLRQWLYAWHVPLFFYISGYFLNCNKGRKRFFGDQVKRLLIPYFFYSIFLVTMQIPKGILKQVNLGEIMKEIMVEIISLLFSFNTNRTIKGYVLNTPGAMWFLCGLFISVLIIFAFRNVNSWVALLCIYGIALLGVSSSQLFELPFQLQEGFIASPFVYFGFKCKEKKVDFTHVDNIFLLIICAALGMLQSVYGINMDIWARFVAHPLLSYVNAILWIIFILIISATISKRTNALMSLLCKLLIFIGENSMWFLIIHSVSMKLIVYKQFIFTLETFGVATIIAEGLILILNIVVASSSIVVINKCKGMLYEK